MTPEFIAYSIGIGLAGALVGGIVWNDRLRRKVRRLDSAVTTERNARIRLECQLESAHIAHYEDVCRLETELVWAQADAIVAEGFGRAA